MLSSIASTPLLNVGRSPAPGIGTWVKNLLFGRIFANWKDSIIVAGVVFWVAKAVLSFFTGAWLMATAEFFTGGFLAMMRKDYRQFTDLHAATGAYRDQNHEFQLSNLALRNSIRNLGVEVGLLAKERQRFAQQNSQFAKSNRVYKAQIDVMKATLNRAIDSIDAANARGRRVSSQILKTALAAFEQKEKALTSIASDIDARNKAAIEQWNQLAGQVGKMNIHGVKALTDAKEQLDEVLAQIREKTATKYALRAEIGRLQKVRADLEDTVGTLQNAALKVNLAADRNLAAAGKRIFSNVMSGKTLESNAAIIMGLAFAGWMITRSSGPAVIGVA